MLPTQILRAWRVMEEPTTGTAACGVSGIRVAGIWPLCCMLLYCIGVMCSNPGGGTSQYRLGLRRLLAFFRSPPRSRSRSRDLDRLRSLSLSLLLLLSLLSRSRSLLRLRDLFSFLTLSSPILV